MLVMRSFINLLMVPVVAYYVYHKRNKQEMIPNFDSLILYVLFVVCNIPVTRVITFAIKISIGMRIEADSSYYTIAALISAAFLPRLYVYLKKYFDMLLFDYDTKEKTETKIETDR